jgi:hypothetical protein
VPARQQHRPFLHRLVLVVLVFALSLPLSDAYVGPSMAQEGLSGAGGIAKIFKRLRERFIIRERNRVVRRKSRRKTRRTTSRRQTEQPARVAPVEAAKKLENARVILVVGDFLADGLASGLDVAFKDSPGVRVVERTSGSSGFVRDDFYNWPAEITPIIEEEQPAVVVVMLGSNDRQSMHIDGRNEPVRSEAWIKEYESRATALANAIQKQHVPFVWVGMPSFKYSNMSSDMLGFNDIYRRVAERGTGSFVDIWDGFVDENGQFSRTGPDINGLDARLRSGDGINMTEAGKRKMAFYAEKPLRKLLGPAASPQIGALGPQALPSTNYDPSHPGNTIERTIPISLMDPELDGGSELLGGSTPERPESPRTPGEKLAIEGVAPKAQPGRADDFSLSHPRISRESPPPATDRTSTTAIQP